MAEEEPSPKIPENVDYKKMKIKVLERDMKEVTRERLRDLPKMHRNPAPELHPFEREREYVRALNAVKLERLFAKPFVGQLSGGHLEGIYCMAKHSKNLTAFLSGSADGSVALWDLGNLEGAQTTTGGLLSVQRPKVALSKAHGSFVRGVTFVPGARDGNLFLSCADEGIVKLWDARGGGNATDSTTTPLEEHLLVRQYVSKTPFTGLDHQWGGGGRHFATSGNTVSIWQTDRPAPVQTFAWGHDTYTTLRFNPSEPALLAAAATDRSLVLYDLRLKSPLTRVVLGMRTNAICWNPMEPFNFAIGNEDTNAYIYDMRHMATALTVLRDHVGPVMDIDYSPTGQELATGSYDKSVRIFSATGGGHSRDIYHTRRMQRIFSTRFSMDAQYLFTGSDDGSLRIWRAKATQAPGALHSGRQQAALHYNLALADKFAQLPEIKRIRGSRHVPKPIKAAQRDRRLIEGAKKRREENRRRHTRPGTVPYKSQRRTNIVEIKK